MNTIAAPAIASIERKMKLDIILLLSLTLVPLPPAGQEGGGNVSAYIYSTQQVGK
jgi:hypothetical protein